MELLQYSVLFDFIIIFLLLIQIYNKSNATITKKWTQYSIYRQLLMSSFKVFGGLLMGCINGKQLLNEEDLNYIARNTAMDKTAVEVK